MAAEPLLIIRQEPLICAEKLGLQLCMDTNLGIHNVLVRERSAVRNGGDHIQEMPHAEDEILAIIAQSGSLSPSATWSAMQESR